MTIYVEYIAKWTTAVLNGLSPADCFGKHTFAYTVVLVMYSVVHVDNTWWWEESLQAVARNAAYIYTQTFMFFATLNLDLVIGH